MEFCAWFLIGLFIIVAFWPETEDEKTEVSNSCKPHVWITWNNKLRCGKCGLKFGD